MYRDAVPCGQNVLAHQARGPTELYRFAINEEALVAECGSRFREGLERRDCAIHIELGVGTGVAAVRHGQADQLVAILLKQGGGFLNEFAALLEAQGPQGGAACSAGEIERLFPIEAVRRGVSEDFFSRGILEWFALSRALAPFATQITLELGHGRLEVS